MTSCKLGKCRVDAQTAHAIHVVMKEDNEEHWIPQSVVHDDSEVWSNGDEGELVVKEWWAEKNGFL